MTPARSLAASVVALGFVSALTAPQPALAAPAACERAENFAAQSGAEMLRIDRLEVHPAAEQPRESSGREEKGTLTNAPNRALSSDDDPIIPDPEDSDTLSEGIGLIGTGALGYLGVLPKKAAKTDGDADVVPPTENDLAGGESTGSGGTGGGEPVDENSDDEDGEAAPSDDGARPKTASLADVGLGEARTAMIAKAPIASAAYARMLNGYPGNKASGKYASMVKPLLQQAPPTNATASRRSTPAGKAGPLRLGRGGLGTHAQWDSGLACGRVAGEAGRADASLTSVSLMNDLVRVPGSMTSRGTTALERRDDEPRSVARSTMTADRVELAGGQVHLRVLRAPVLEAAMSANSGGKISYRPAIVEISGDGIATRRLSTAGEHVDISVGPRYHEMESAARPNLGELNDLRRAEPLPVPAVPDLPSVDAPETESAPAASEGLKVRVALGDVRHAIKGQAIAARASAIKVALIQPTSSKDGYGAQAGVSLTMSMGLLEAAAVSPEAQEIQSSGSGGGLPVTGSDVTRVALAGGGLLLAGAIAILFSVRRRRSQS